MSLLLAVAKSLSRLSGEYDSSATVPSVRRLDRATRRPRRRSRWSGWYTKKYIHAARPAAATSATASAMAAHCLLAPRRNAGRPDAALRLSAAPRRFDGVGLGRPVARGLVAVGHLDVGGVLLSGHGTNSTFDIFIWPPSRARSTLSRHARGSCLAPAALVTRDVAATRTRSRCRRSSTRRRWRSHWSR